MEEYKQYLYEFVYNKVWSELSSKDRRILRAVAETESGSVQEIKDKLGITVNEWNPYRQRLIRKGVVDDSLRGRLRLSLPLFDQFVKDKVDFNEI